jgi:hypothetical protein
MIRKTFKQNIELPINETVLGKYWLDNGTSQTVKTEWTVDMQGDELMDMDIVSCDADLDERQYDRLKEICLAMRHMPAITVDLIDESVIDVSPKDWNEYLAFSKFDVTVQSDESYNFLQSHFREA